MVSELAIAEIETLASQGIALTAREIIRLNAFGLRVERCDSAADTYALPRVAFLGDHALREPTVGHEIWLADAAAYCEFGDAPTELAVHAAALLVPDSCDLPRLSGWFVRPRLYAFVKSAMRKLAAYTPQQIRVAVDYAEFGADATLGEKLPETSRKAVADETNARLSVAVGVLLDGVCAGLSASVEDLRRLGSRQVSEMARRAYTLKGADVGKACRSRAEGEFYAVLAEIEEAHKAEGKKDGE